MEISSIYKFILFSILLSHHGVEASHIIFEHFQVSNLTTIPAHQPYRTGYHFQPPRNWINDPNGPMIFKGIYHLFYQYSTNGSVWGNIVWAHSTSKDLINWRPHKNAIWPSEKFDIEGTWSGSATILPGGKPVILYTGLDPEKNQVQNIAYPKNLSDPYLEEWDKDPKNPLMAPDSTNNINASSFRDPTTAWIGPDKVWRVIIGSKIDRLGLAILYTSKDFTQWTKAKEPLHSAKHTGMWECVDFFPVATDSNKGLDTSYFGNNTKYVMKISLDDTKKDYYTLGSYDYKTDKYCPDKGSDDSTNGLKYDYGKFYASKTFFDDSKSRRVLWGWVNESSPVKDDVKKGWAGVQAIPRTVWLDKCGKQLMQWPVEELNTLRGEKVCLPNKVLEGGSKLEVTGITAAQADVEVTFEIPDLEKAETLDPHFTHPQLLCSQHGASAKGQLGPFGLLVLTSKEFCEYTAVFFRIYKQNNKHVVLMCSDQTMSSTCKENDRTPYGAFLDIDPTKEKLCLRTLIDHSIVESFGGGGKVVITSRVYPTIAIGDKAQLYAFNNGTEKVTIANLNAWSMKKADLGW